MNKILVNKIWWANTENFIDAEFIVLGIPDESQSNSLWKGTEEAPSQIKKLVLKKI